LLCSAADAQLEVQAGSSLFREAGGPLEMTVVVPEVDAEVTIEDSVAIRAGWTADIVSGASVAVVDAPAATVDAISAASVHDTRHVLGGGVTLLEEQSSLSLGYRYGFENDYRSHGFDVAARTELFDRNTALEVGYARSFDLVCDGPGAEDPVQKPRLDSSDGCFDDDATDREDRDLDVHSLQVAVTQALTPALLVQATLGATLQNGLLANPYRAVRIGQTAAQEHHPENRARYSATLSARYYLEPVSGALQPSIRVYRDSWDLRAISTELGYEQGLGAGLRLRARGRLHVQSGAGFYSDAYVLMPRGRYFTGDRELSPLKTLLAGAQVGWTVPPGRSGLVAGVLSGLELTLKGDVIRTFFDDFHYDRVAPPNDTAILATLSLLARF
jgi:hypothetical protein